MVVTHDNGDTSRCPHSRQLHAGVRATDQAITQSRASEHC
jgi:hypothetical protein